jgi:excisionase family DNA binding protein
MIVSHQDSDELARRTFTIEEAAKVLGIGRNTAYDAARTGDLATVRLGRRLLVPRHALFALLGENDEAPAATPGPRETSTAGQGRHGRG